MRLSSNQIFIALLITLIFVALPARAEDSWLGYLVDGNCAESFKHFSDPLQAAREHRKICLLKPESIKSGYEIYANDKWFKLDANGNKLAEEAANQSISLHGVYVSVIGVQQGDVIAVKKLSEIMDTPSKTIE